VPGGGDDTRDGFMDLTKSPRKETILVTFASANELWVILWA